MPSYPGDVPAGSALTPTNSASCASWPPRPATAKHTTAAHGIFRAVIRDYLTADEPEDASGGRNVRAGDEGPSLPIIVEPLEQPTEVPAPPVPQEPVREPEKVPA